VGKGNSPLKCVGGEALLAKETLSPERMSPTGGGK
jgi:hypothetical protein